MSRSNRWHEKRSRTAYAALVVMAALTSVPAEVTTIRSFLQGVERESASNTSVYSLTGDGFAGIPYLRDAEIRIRNEAFDFGRQRYSLQLSPKGFGEGSAARRLNGTLSGRNEGTREALRNNSLKERYTLVIDYLAGTTLADLYDRLATLEGERIRVLERQSVSDAFDLGDILRSETSQTRHRERAEEARALASQAISRARALTGAHALSGFDTAGVASASTVLSRLDGLESQGSKIDSSNVHLRGARDDAAAAHAQYNLEQAESRRYISFVEFGYDHGNRRNEIEERSQGDAYDLDRAYIMEIGFRIPWVSTDRSGILRRRAELLNRRMELSKDGEEIAADLRSEVSAARALGARYSALVARDAELDIPARLKRYAALGAADPLVILTLRQAQVENALRREEVRLELLRTYLEAVDLAGEIARKPARNLLSTERETLGE